MEDQKFLEKMREEMLAGFKHVDQRLDKVEKRLDGRIDEVLEAMGIFSNTVEKRFKKIEEAMVTKEYLNEQLLDLRSDLIVLARKQNKKLSSVVEALVEEGSLSRKAAKQLLALEPFAL